MIYYVLVLLAALLFSLQFFFNDKYQKEAGSGMKPTLIFLFYGSVAGFLIALITNKFKIDFSLFSFIIALIYGFVNLGLTYSSIKSFQYASLSAYSVFSMIGGMALPFLYGVLTGEKLTFTKVLCCILIAVSVSATGKDNQRNKKAFKYYITVFILNGMVGVLSEIHQSATTLCVDSGSFLILTKLTTVLLCIIFMFTTRCTPFTNIKKLLLSGGHAVLNSTGNLFLLITLTKLPASVQYPFVTGGVMFFSLLIDIITKKDVGKRNILSVLIAIISSVLIVF